MSTSTNTRRGFLKLGLCLALFSALGFATQSPKPKPEGKLEAPAKELRVLFVGNSYCYVNDLPKLVVDLGAADAGAPKIAVESVTPGGATMKQHWESTGALEKIRSGKFTHVVLQGQSLEPVANTEEFLTHARKLIVEVQNAGAVPVLYQTWARREGAPEYKRDWSKGSPKRMQTAISAAYDKAAANSKARIARVGDAWGSLMEEQGPPALFDADGSHPSPTGTYLAGCVLYEALTGRRSAELDVRREGVTPELARRLRQSVQALATK